MRPVCPTDGAASAMASSVVLAFEGAREDILQIGQRILEVSTIELFENGPKP